MHMEKRKEAAFLIYFAILLFFAIYSMISNFDIIDLGYIVIVLSCVLKFILIVHKNEK